MRVEGLFQLGDFTLHSGAKSDWKIECNSLTQDDLECLAEMVCQMVGRFSSIEGVPTGGLKLASILASKVCSDGPHLIVDDVLTTGGSMWEAWYPNVLPAEKHPQGIVGAVVFARGRCPFWVKPLFQMPEELWVKE
jgi:orotate phosphoribosyltransferase